MTATPTAAAMARVAPAAAAAGPAGPARAATGLVLASGLLSTLADAMLLIAAPWLAIRLTGTVLAGGIVAAVEAAALVVAGVVGGPIVDRLGSRRPAVWSELLAAGVVAALCVAQAAAGSYAVLLVAVAVKGVVAAPASAAHQRLLPSLAALSATDPARLNAAYWLLQRIGLLAGASAVAVLATLGGTTSTLTGVALGYLLAGALVALALRGQVRADVERRERADGSASGPAPADVAGGRSVVGDYAADVAAGLRAIGADLLLRAILGGALALNTFDSALIPIVLPALDERAGSTAGLGWQVSCYAGGALAATLGAAVLAARLRPRPTVLACLVTSGAAYAVLGGGFGAPVSLAALAALGLAAGPLLPVLLTVVQERVPNAMLGRVTGTLFALMTASVPAGRVLAGACADRFGTSVWPVTTAVAFVLVAACLARLPSWAAVGERA